MKFFGFLFLCTCLFFWQLGSESSITNNQRSIFLRDIDESKILHKKFDVGGFKSSDEMVKSICVALFTDNPSQELFNRELKKIYFYSLKKQLSADLLNLQGRLFWYKVHLNNQEKMCADFWSIRWKGCAAQSWRMAKQRYSNDFSKFCLYIQEWMPEKEMFTMEEYKKYICNESAKDMVFLLRRAFDASSIE
ncbi:hypothetical protein [Candidatus Uabimicrobium sp. HlEnr_7]|uniref:hypothetical protein n=1 Tax=Candidatus Uabimicrobium helgolandensis TaxID=3095367 RepID=UPI003556FEDA